MKNDGGPAFPVCNMSMPECMSLRDWFAGQALVGCAQGLLMARITARASGTDLDPRVDSDAKLAESAYKFADAMLEERAGNRIDRAKLEASRRRDRCTDAAVRNAPPPEADADPFARTMA